MDGSSASPNLRFCQETEDNKILGGKIGQNNLTTIKICNLSIWNLENQVPNDSHFDDVPH